MAYTITECLLFLPELPLHWDYRQVALSPIGHFLIHLCSVKSRLCGSLRRMVAYSLIENLGDSFADTKDGF